MSKFVYDDRLGPARQGGVNIELLDDAAAIVASSPRKDFETLCQGLSFLAPMGFSEANHHVDAIRLRCARACQHGVCFADARRRAEENPELAAPIFISYGEQRIGIGTAVKFSFRFRHAASLSVVERGKTY
jgi:hypothetical protein